MTLKRDIIATLTLKLSLLFLLWFVCFKPVEREKVDTQARFFGSDSTVSSSKAKLDSIKSNQYTENTIPNNKSNFNHLSTEVTYDSWH